MLTSEYAHAMGNALGNFREYWDEIYSHPRMLGGFIWEWADEGIFTEREGKRMTAYGGDFGDAPNLKAFCLKGIVSSDRLPTPKYEEVKAVYSPIQFNDENGRVVPVMRDAHCDLNDYDIHQIEHGGLMNATATLKTKTLWAEAGHEVVRSQWVTDARWYEHAKHCPTCHPVRVVPKNRKNQQRRPDELRADAAEWMHRLLPHLFRAPTDNDKGFGNWIAKDWKQQQLDQQRHTLTTSPVFTTNADGAVVSNATFVTQTLEGCITTEYTATFLPDGSIDLCATFTPEGTLPPLPCLGTTLELPKDLKNLTYFGRGPIDNYPDRHAAATIGLWRSTVAEQYVHYPRPQDSGNHDDTAYLELTDAKGNGWRVSCTDSPFSFSVLPYSVEQLYTATHDCDLVEDAEHIFLNLDAAVLGLGNSSCGPGVLKKYTIPQQPHTLHVRIEKIGK